MTRRAVDNAGSIIRAGGEPVMPIGPLKQAALMARQPVSGLTFGDLYADQR